MLPKGFPIIPYVFNHMQWFVSRSVFISMFRIAMLFSEVYPCFSHTQISRILYIPLYPIKFHSMIYCHEIFPCATSHAIHTSDHCFIGGFIPWNPMVDPPGLRWREALREALARKSGGGHKSTWQEHERTCRRWHVILIICMHAYLCIYIHIYIYVYIYIHVCMYAYLCIYIHNHRYKPM